MSKRIMGVELPSQPPKTETDSELLSDKATVKLIRGRGFVLTFSSHFAVAVIVGVLGWVYAQQKRESAVVPDEVTHSIRELQTTTAGLQADFRQFKAEREQSDKMTERSLNELIARTARQ